jgi:hypothetical protein
MKHPTKTKNHLQSLDGARWFWIYNPIKGHLQPKKGHSRPKKGFLLMYILIRFFKFCGNFFGKISLHCTPKRLLKSRLYQAYREYRLTETLEILNALGYGDDEAIALLSEMSGGVK